MTQKELWTEASKALLADEKIIEYENPENPWDTPFFNEFIAQLDKTQGKKDGQSSRVSYKWKVGDFTYNFKMVVTSISHRTNLEAVIESLTVSKKGEKKTVDLNSKYVDKYFYPLYWLF